MTLPRVLLPAPFSPMRAWTSPGRKATETSSSAWVMPKRLEMFWAMRRSGIVVALHATSPTTVTTASAEVWRGGVSGRVTVEWCGREEYAES